MHVFLRLPWDPPPPTYVLSLYFLYLWLTPPPPLAHTTYPFKLAIFAPRPLSLSAPTQPATKDDNWLKMLAVLRVCP